MQTQRGPVRVLLVDDDEDDAAELRDLLYQCRTPAVEEVEVLTSHGARALEAITGVDVLVYRGQRSPTGVQWMESFDEGGAPCALIWLPVQEGLSPEEAGPMAVEVLERSLQYALDRHRRVVQFRDVLFASPDGVAILDEAHRLLFLNPAGKALLGGAVSQFTGQSFAYLTSGSEHLLPTGRLVEVRLAPIEWRRQACQLATLRDITRRRTMAQRSARHPDGRNVVSD